ncbi:membrane or secreted protein [marine sediment metagenome]|uniref:Membrane or secreted protein n=1 Tax=marine sediment metagenome TaxID=412755 RepID=A0A1B6NTV7_9ZZZZ
MESVRIIRRFLVFALASGAFLQVLASSLVSGADVDPHKY